MKSEIEVERTEFVCRMLVEYSATTTFTGYTCPSVEDYGIDDAWVVSTAGTQYPLENKTICGGYTFKKDGEFRDYYKVEMYNRIRFEQDVASGAPLYILNAEDERGGRENCKWSKLVANEKSLVSFIAADGIVVFSHKTLMEALVGFGYYETHHSTEFGKQGGRRWERKAVIDLSKGLFISCRVPPKLLKKQ